MAAAEKSKEQNREETPSHAWLVGLVGWLVPGAGHLLQRQWMRAALLGGAVWTSFVLGLVMGGHMFSPEPSEHGSSAWLQVPPMVANLGTGLLYIASWLVGVGFDSDPLLAARATYEYGNTFLLLAGLLNYLAMLDAFDISAGRKS